uniref:RNA polymerase sigma factor n=1 Tax=Eiseniibacteriota bacterium TaxID=2212470 RepID=A0A832I831_UNCEI
MNASDFTGWTDEALVRAACEDPGGAHGRAAASALLGRHQRRVYLWCWRYVKERERALDLAQETLASAWRALPRFEGRSSFTSWLFVIARNRCLNAVSAPALLRDEEADPNDAPDAALEPLERMVRQEDEEGLRRLLVEHLDDAERAALWMRCFDRLPVEEITVALGLGNATGARALLQRARRKLRAALERRARKGAEA